MHEIERQRIILGEIADRPVVTVAQLVELTGASEATIRRDINALHAGRQAARGVRGGAEALHPPQLVDIWRPALPPSAEQMNVDAEALHRQGGGRSLRRRAMPSSSMAARPPSRWSITSPATACRS